VDQSRVHDVEEWTFGIGFNRVQLIAQLLDSASSRLHTLPNKDILSSDNMLIERAVIKTVKQCSKFVEYVFQIG